MKKNRAIDVGWRSHSGKKVLLAIKLLSCILILGNSVAYGKAYSQARFSMNVSDVSLVEVFKEITQKTGYDFVYSSNILERAGRVSLNMKEETLDKVLAECLKGTDLWYKFEDTFIIISPKIGHPAMPQKTILIKGIVKDKLGETLPGVTVLLKGAKIGVSTDENGEFQFPVPESSEIVLMFSFVGMKPQEVKVKDDKPLKVILEEDVKAIDEVVVNGMFTQSKNSYTGSVTTIKSEDILAVSQTNLLKALTILTPGMRIVENNEQGSNPNHIPEIIIRGTTSIASEGEYGLNTPLIILDGVEISLERLYDLDVFDIESVSVLKDASATAIYGERAANGVIVVVRKRVDDSKLRVRYNFVPNIQFPDVSSFNLCNAAQKLEVERMYGLYDSPIGEYDELYNEKLKRVNSGVNTDWKSKPLRNSYSFDHSLSVTGRGGGMDYSLNARYGDVRGVMKGDFRTNYGVGFYLSYFFKDRLSVSLRADFSKTDTKNSPYGDFSDFVRINPYDVSRNERGEWNKILSYRQRNPLYDASTNSFNQSKSKSLGANLSLRWDVIKNFYVTLMGNYSLSDGRSDVFKSPESSDFIGENNPNARGSYSLDGSEGNTWSVQAALNYSILLDGEGTILSLHAGESLSKKRSTNFGFMGIGFLKPEFTDINFATAYPASHPSGQEVVSATVGIFGNMNFIYKNRYFADVSYRTSGSSDYGKENRFSPFWSAGLGWNIHNESFMERLKFITTFRVRGSMGYTGSVNFAGSQSVTTYLYDEKNGYYVGLGANPVAMGNDRLKWQTTLNYNLGLNFEILKGRFDFNFDIYKQVTKDLLLAVSLPPSVGVTSVKENLGESRNWGYEWGVSGQIVKNQSFYWRVGLNGHHTENKLVKVSNSLKRQNDKNMKETGLVAPKIQLEEGESSTAIYAVRSLGIDPATGKEIFIRKDGSYTLTYNPEDKVALGESTPSFEGALTTNLAYKGFSVSAAMSITLGGDIYNSTRASKIESINPEINVDARVFTQRWKNPGDVTNYVRLEKNQGAYGHSERFIERKNELYLSSVNVSYDFKPEWVRHIGLKKLRVGVTFSDVLRLSTVKFERGTSYPYMRGFNFSISPTF